MTGNKQLEIPKRKPYVATKPINYTDDLAVNEEAQPTQCHAYVRMSNK